MQTILEEHRAENEKMNNIVSDYKVRALIQDRLVGKLKYQLKYGVV